MLRKSLTVLLSVAGLAVAQADTLLIQSVQQAEATRSERPASGLTKEQVGRLRKEFSIYAVDTGRICVAALSTNTVDYVADAIAQVIR